MKKLFLFPVMLLFALTITHAAILPMVLKNRKLNNRKLPEMMVTKIINQKTIV